jgi:hypothetical protein
VTSQVVSGDDGEVWIKQVKENVAVVVVVVVKDKML